MMYWGGHMNGWGYFFMGLSTIAFWGLLVAAGVLVFREMTRRQPPSTQEGRPEQVLAERYARGDINDDEYRRRLDTLRRA